MSYTIGQLAKALEINVETIRYYERRGLIQRPTKKAVGYRTYSTDILKRIRFIIGAKSLGFTLREIQLGLSQIDETPDTCDFVTSLLNQKAVALSNQIQSLENQLKEIDALKYYCSVEIPQERCVVDERLGSGGNVK